MSSVKWYDDAFFELLTYTDYYILIVIFGLLSSGKMLSVDDNHSYDLMSTHLYLKSFCFAALQHKSIYKTKWFSLLKPSVNSYNRICTRQTLVSTHGILSLRNSDAVILIHFFLYGVILTVDFLWSYVKWEYFRNPSLPFNLLHI